MMRLSSKIGYITIASVAPVNEARFIFGPPYEDASGQRSVSSEPLKEARAAEYAYHPGGATGMVVKEYRGKNGQQEIWEFDEALVKQINATLKQVAIEEGQWSEQRPLSDRQAAPRTGATVLDNTRHELFAQSVASGTSATEAYCRLASSYRKRIRLGTVPPDAWSEILGPL
jgi:hypothetical protein